MNTLNRWTSSLFRSPLLWGGLAASLYYMAIRFGLIDNGLLVRYTAGHSVEYIVTTGFLIGLAALAIKAFDVVTQRPPSEPLLGRAPLGGQTVEDAQRLLGDLDRAPARLQRGYLVRRIRDALEHVHRNGNAESLDSHVKYLSDLDAVHAQHSYAFVRVIIWAIPILGLLGTVIGITSVFASLKGGAVNEEAISHIVDGMSVAFDTTGLALGLCMTLMFIQYFVDRMESALLTEVDSRANAELIGRFQTTSLGSDPELAPVRRMVEAVLQATDRLVSRQAEIWRASLDAADERFAQLAASSGKQLETALAGALDQSLKVHAAHLTSSEQGFAEHNQKNWGQVAQALVQTADAATKQHAELAKQSEVLLKVVEATGLVVRLEDTLNRNLAALGGARNFEETLVALSAAVQLLGARLGSASHELPALALAKPKRVDKAA